MLIQRSDKSSVYSSLSGSAPMSVDYVIWVFAIFLLNEPKGEYIYINDMLHLDLWIVHAHSLK